MGDDEVQEERETYFDAESEETENLADTEDGKSPVEAEPAGPQEWDDMEVTERLEMAKLLKKRGNDQFGEGNYRESIEIYTKGLGFCPDSEPDFRSILFSNRSAAKIKLDMKTEAVEDCTQALEHNPNYIRALLRRAKLYEELEKLDEALSDYNKLLELDPSNREARLAIHGLFLRSVFPSVLKLEEVRLLQEKKLPGEINERNEKLKTEMLGKLKELGNMVLRPFGLSTDNFQMQQDPNTGGYSVNFSKS